MCSRLEAEFALKASAVLMNLFRRAVATSHLSWKSGRGGRPRSRPALLPWSAAWM